MSIKAILFSIIFISIWGGGIWYLIFNKKYPLSFKKQEDNWIKDQAKDSTFDVTNPNAIFSQGYMQGLCSPEPDIENPPSTTDILEH